MPEPCSNRTIPLHIVQDIQLQIDQLYQRPLAEFIDARNKLAADWRPRDRAAAQAIKKRVKPSVSAWAVNQAYWRDREHFDALLDAGETLRALQKQALEGEVQSGDMQAAMLAQRAALTEVSRCAEQALSEGGHNVNNTTLRKIKTTLEALSAHGRDGSAPHPGRLSADVPAPGFGALAALASDTPARPASRRQKPATRSARRRGARTAERGRKSANDNSSDAPRQPGRSASRSRVAERTARRQARKQATRAVEEATADLASLERARDDAKSAEKSALDRVYAAEKTIVAAKQELERVTAIRDEALLSAERAKANTESAHTSVDGARTRLQAAARELAALTE